MACTAPTAIRRAALTAPSFVFAFEELPLITERGFEAGLVNGTAEVTYHPNGEWFVHSICLDGSKWNGTTYERKSVELDDDRSWLYVAIWGVLNEGRFKDQIDVKVAEALTDGAALRRADHAHAMAV